MARCPSNSEKTSGACFFSPVGKGRISDGSAELLCSSAGGHLASVESEDEQKALMKVAKTLSGRPYIGAKRSGANSQTWSWIDGRPWSFEEPALRSGCMGGSEVTVGLDGQRWCGLGDGSRSESVICSIKAAYAGFTPLQSHTAPSISY